MCAVVKFRHVHCTARNFSGKKCDRASSVNPCPLCVWQGRGPDYDEPPKPQPATEEDF